MITNVQIQASLETITEYLISQIMNIKKCNKEQAFIILTNTSTYDVLMNKKSELYAESPQYVFSMLEDEFNNDFESWLEN